MTVLPIFSPSVIHASGPVASGPSTDTPASITWLSAVEAPSVPVPGHEPSRGRHENSVGLVDAATWDPVDPLDIAKAALPLW